MARSLPVENLLPQNVGWIINYLQYSTEVAQFGTPSCSWRQPAPDNDVKNGRSNWLVAPPPSWAAPPDCLVHSINRCSLSRESTLQPSACKAHLAYAATQGIQSMWDASNAAGILLQQEHLILSIWDASNAAGILLQQKHLIQSTFYYCFWELMWRLIILSLCW